MLSEILVMKIKGDLILLQQQHYHPQSALVQDQLH